MKNSKLAWLGITMIAIPCIAAICCVIYLIPIMSLFVVWLAIGALLISKYA